MSTSFLHITNGDQTTEILRKSKIKGEFNTWREMLCEGKTTTEVGSEHFWRHRFDFLKTSYKITKKTFIDYTLKEYRNLCNHKKQEEITLWFDPNLFSQINMIAVISWLKTHRKGRKISIVNYKNTSDVLRNFSSLSQVECQEAYQNKSTLTQDAIEYADYTWQLYCSESPLRLEAILKSSAPTPFIHLEKALKLHLQRFPSLGNGLNSIENKLLQTANQTSVKSANQLVSSLIETQIHHGYNDLQYQHRTDKLQQLFATLNPLKLSKIGKKVLENQINYYAHLRSDFSYLGGSKKYSFLYLEDTQKLLQITS